MSTCHCAIGRLVGGARGRTDRTRTYVRMYVSHLTRARALALAPELPRRTVRPPRRIDEGTQTHEWETVEEYYRQKYYALLDTLLTKLDNRFDQQTLFILSDIENMITSAANRVNFTLPQTLRTLYSDDLDLDRLKVHLTMLPDVVLQQNIFTKSLLSELHKLLRLYFTIPMSNANSEISFSSLRRLKTYLRSTMSQKKLNHVAFLHVHKHLTRALDLKSICKTFSSTNDRRRAFFGTWKWCSFKFFSIQNYLGKFEGTSIACAQNALKTLILTISLPDLGTGPVNLKKIISLT